MSIKDSLEKIKGFWQTEEGKREKVLTIAIIFLVGTASFGLGKLSSFDSQKQPVQIKMKEFSSDISQVIGSSQATENTEIPEKTEIDLKQGGFLVASKNSDKYHFPWCSGAKRMKEENKIYFASIEEARSAGYKPAGNCKGLE